MPIRDTSLLALKKIAKYLEPDEQAVFEILLELGPAHDRRILEALNQRDSRVWEINSVTGRRNRLVGLGVVEDLGPHRGNWHSKKKTYHIWRVKHDCRTPVGWELVPEEGRPKRKSKREAQKRLDGIQAQAGAAILRALRAGKQEQLFI